MLVFCVIIPAAGQSTRFGRNKLLEPLGGIAVIARSVEAFAQRDDVARIVIATSDPHVASAVRNAHRRMDLVAGGSCRAESVRNALGAVPDDIDWVAVHDAARPLVSQALIHRTLVAAVEHGAAAPALPVNLTIKQAAGPLPAKIERTVARDRLWALQTPQIMRRETLRRAFQTCPIPLEQVTDDLQLLELARQDAYLVPGDESNIKITTPTDLHLAEFLLSQ